MSSNLWFIKQNKNKKLLFFWVFVSAKISTRPGQVGACDGYILEGKDLEAIQSNLNINTIPSESRTD
jgi:hypothetical protein